MLGHFFLCNDCQLKAINNLKKELVMMFYFTPVKLVSSKNTVYGAVLVALAGRRNLEAP